MIIYGWKQYVQVLAVLQMVCGQCGNNAEHVLRKLTTKFTLFFIPLFPINKKRTLFCTACEHEHKVPKAQAEQLVATGGMAAPCYGPGTPPPGMPAPAYGPPRPAMAPPGYGPGPGTPAMAAPGPYGPPPGQPFGPNSGQHTGPNPYPPQGPPPGYPPQGSQPYPPQPPCPPYPPRR